MNERKIFLRSRKEMLEKYRDLMLKELEKNEECKCESDHIYVSFKRGDEKKRCTFWSKPAYLDSAKHVEIEYDVEGEVCIKCGKKRTVSERIRQR